METVNNNALIALDDLELNPSKLFYSLPLFLQRKIVPSFKKRTPEQVAVDLKRLSTIHPAKYFSRTAALRGSGSAASGGIPPITNRGGKSQYLELPSFQALESLKIESLGKRGGYKSVLIPHPDKTALSTYSFIDWINFTFKTASLPMSLNTGHQALSDYEYVQGLSKYLFDIFGFGVTNQREGGLNMYKNSFDVGSNGWGIVCIGGQNDTCLVTIKGQGLMASKPGWEYRLYKFLSKISTAKITRIDLASDNFHSSVSIDEYLTMYQAGLFTNRGRTPNVEQAGNWIKPNGKGRTLYVGNRKSGKLLRIYEKGLQLANGFHERFPNWIRTELELKNDDRIIPFDTLLKPGQYLAGAYPALNNLHKVQTRIDTFKNTAKSTVERAVETTRHQFGKYIWSFIELFGIEETIEKLTNGKEEIPKRLDLFNTHENIQESEYLHSHNIHTIDLDSIPLHTRNGDNNLFYHSQLRGS